MKRLISELLIATVVFIGGFFLGRQSMLAPQRDQAISFNDVIASAQAGQVRDVTISGTTLIGRYVTGKQFSTTVPANDPQMFNVLVDHGVNITYKDENSNFWISTLISVILFLILAAVPFAALCLIVFLVLRSRTPRPSPQQ